MTFEVEIASLNNVRINYQPG